MRDEHKTTSSFSAPGKPKILVTGLCMQGNLGGPALALSLHDRLTRLLPTLSFVFAVPGGSEYPHEQRAAVRHDLLTVPIISMKHLLPTTLFSRNKYRETAEFFRALREADIVLDMTALTYVSPPRGTIFGAINNRFFFHLAARMTKTPFLAWTQTYGPFDHPVIRRLAKQDLLRLPRVYCRGEETRRAVLNLLPRSEVLDFPDIACGLKAAVGRDQPDEARSIEPSKLVISLSPSSVVYAETGGGGASNSHIRLCAQFLAQCVQKDYVVWLVPHTMRREAPSVENCDLQVCNLIYELAGKPDCVHVLVPLNGPRQAKAWIAKSHIHVGARYHSLVAALSSAVPSVSLAWHHKYRDLLRQYSVQDFVLDALNEPSLSDLSVMIDKILNQFDQLRELLGARQHLVEQSLQTNVEMFLEDVEHVLGSTKP